MLRHFADTFDGDMQVLPIPAEMPPEIPRVTLRSADGKRQFNAALSRIDFIITSPESMHLAVDESSELVAKYSSEMGVTGLRLALVVSRTCPQADPAQALISRFCNEEAKLGPFARSATFEINNHKEFQPRGLDYSVNSWVRCTCSKKDKDSAILVSQDLNTIQKDIRSFQDSNIRQFFSAASIAADEILELYFPG